jgi:hypothetical protein
MCRPFTNLFILYIHPKFQLDKSGLWEVCRARFLEGVASGECRSFVQVLNFRPAPVAMVSPRSGCGWGREGFGAGRRGRGDGRGGHQGYAWQCPGWRGRGEFHQLQGDAQTTAAAGDTPPPPPPPLPSSNPKALEISVNPK